MKEAISGNKQKLVRCVGEIMVIGMWLIYFVKFSHYYNTVEILIRDNQPLVNKLLIFITYSPKDSIVYFTIGGILVFLLVLLMMLSYSNKSAQTKIQIGLTMLVNAVLIVSLCKPMIFPLYITFLLGSVMIVYPIVIFMKKDESDEDEYSADDYEIDEESYEVNNEKNTIDE